MDFIYFIVLSGQVCTSSVQFILRFSSFEKRLFYVYAFMNVYVCMQCPQRPEQGTNSLELALQTVMRHHGAGNQTWFPSQGNQYS